jgi:hypothetical protein
LERCIADDRIIVTQNARDFRRLLGQVELHPGLIILPAVDREGTWTLLESVIKFLNERGEPMSVMVNHVIEVVGSGEISFASLLRQ